MSDYPKWPKIWLGKDGREYLLLDLSNKEDRDKFNGIFEDWTRVSTNEHSNNTPTYNKYLTLIIKMHIVDLNIISTLVPWKEFTKSVGHLLQC